MYPLLDGEVWGLVEDIIDQQRYINRLISLLDFIIGASAKGVLLFPETAKPDDMTMDEIAEEWVKYDGVIKYKPRPGVEVPQQIAVNSTNIGAHELLAVQLKFMQEISGVSPAIQGQNPQAGTPASLYAQEAQNATINIKDYMDSFTEFQRNMDQKTLQLIQQYYNEPRYMAISGKDYKEESKEYDPMKVKNMKYDVNIVQGVDTPMYRQLIEQTLDKLLTGGYIDLPMYLENSTIPFADKLLEQIQLRQERMAEGSEPNDISQELLSQVQNGNQKKLNPNSNKMINHLTRPEQLRPAV